MKNRKQAQRPSESPRQTAWRILVSWESGNDALEAIRDSFLRRSGADIRDRALITELTQGTVRHKLFLDHTVSSSLHRPGQDLPPPVRMALLLGAYQLIHLHRIPAHAAVKETVQVIKGSRYRRYSSLVNAVLRKISDKGPAPVPFFEDDPARHIELATSAPEWLVQKLSGMRGLEETLQILQALNRKPPLTLRVIKTRSDRDSLLERIEGSGIQASPGKFAPGAIILENRVPVPDFPPFREGLCTVQDEGAQVIAPLLSPGPGMRILDACAAPGGKTSHLAEFTSDGGYIVAADRSLGRLQMMIDNLQRLGSGGVGLVAADLSPDTSPLAGDTFDRVLLDAPCSGTGVLRRHPEGKWKKDPDAVADLTVIQEGLLVSTAASLKTGGRLLYTTCSLLIEENEEVIDRFLAEHGNFFRVDMRNEFSEMRSDMFNGRGELRLWPHIHDCDGFFACLLEKG